MRIFDEDHIRIDGTRFLCDPVSQKAFTRSRVPLDLCKGFFIKGESMSDNKKYYYLKFKEHYFDQDHVKVIESMQNGHIIL